MHRLWFAVAVALGLAGPAMAAAMSDRAEVQGAPSPRTIMILSEGQSACGAYIAQPDMQAVRVSWVLGYISGVNSRSPATEALAGRSFQIPATVIEWLQSYCASHPLDIMAVAAEALRRDFLAQERQ